MAAIVRLKRRLDEEPVCALILNCKKRKKNDEDIVDEVSKVLKFAGTLNNQEDDIAPHISKINKEDLKDTYKKHVPDITTKVRQQTKEAAESSRFKVVNFFRSSDKDSSSLQSINNSEDDKLPLTVLDVEIENKLNGHTTDLNETDYVYDLYYTNSDDFGDHEDDSVFNVCRADELVFDSFRNDTGFDDSDHESEDSNDENNWRNDYPDEEEGDEDSVDEEDMRNAIVCMTLGKDDLSSDDGEEGFVYSIDSEAAGFEEDVDHTDVRRYGELYARFKARQKKEEEKYNKDLYNGELDDTDDDFYD